MLLDQIIFQRLFVNLAVGRLFGSVIGTATSTTVGLGLLEVGLRLGQRSLPVLLQLIAGLGFQYVIERHAKPGKRFGKTAKAVLEVGVLKGLALALLGFLLGLSLLHLESALLLRLLDLRLPVLLQLLAMLLLRNLLYGTKTCLTEPLASGGVALLVAALLQHL
ncbi:hypothetical protein D3C84_731010 [compost metagenome]